MTKCEPWPAPEHQDPGVNQALIDLGTESLAIAIDNGIGPWSAWCDPALSLLVGATIDDGGNGLPQYRIGTPTLPDE